MLYSRFYYLFMLDELFFYFTFKLFFKNNFLVPLIKWDSIKSSLLSDESEVEIVLVLTQSILAKYSLLAKQSPLITDKKYIYDFIRKMPVRDSAALRKYMNQNEPGVDYNITIERPESLGGGTVTTFFLFD